MTLVSTTPFEAADCAACPGRRRGVCALLPEGVRARLSVAGDEIALETNRRIAVPEPGGRAGPVFLVRAGLVRGQRFALNGRRQILLLAGPGDCIDPSAACTRDCEIETVTPARVCRIDRATFEAIRQQEPALRRALAWQSQDWLDKTRRLTWMLALPVGDRLRLALALASRSMPVETRPDGTLVLTMLLPRTDLADLLATTPETVSRLLHQFADDGLIGIVDPRRFHLRDMDRLTEGLGAMVAA